MSINYDFEFQKEKSLYGSMAYETDLDFASVKDLKEDVAYIIQSLTCDSCGSKKLNGSGITYLITKTYLYKTETKKTLFGSTKEVDKLWKTVYRRADQPRLKPSGLFFKGGYLKCRSCGYTIGNLSILRQEYNKERKR